jgi:hypothetical protein
VRHDISDDRMREALTSAMSCALSYVAAVARARLVDEHGVSLDTATRHARALGATADQVTVAMRCGAEG